MKRKLFHPVSGGYFHRIFLCSINSYQTLKMSLVFCSLCKGIKLKYCKDIVKYCKKINSKHQGFFVCFFFLQEVFALQYSGTFVLLLVGTSIRQELKHLALISVDVRHKLSSNQSNSLTAPSLQTRRITQVSTFSDVYFTKMLSKTACLRIKREQELSEGLHDAVARKIILEGWFYKSEVGQIRV